MIASLIVHVAISLIVALVVTLVWLAREDRREANARVDLPSGLLGKRLGERDR